MLRTSQGSMGGLKPSSSTGLLLRQRIYHSQEKLWSQDEEKMPEILRAKGESAMTI